MIGGVVKHGRTARDARNLGRHLLKDSPEVEVINSAAPDLHGAMADMELARDGSRADSAFLHVYLSPSRDMSRDELREAAQIVLRHFGAEEHQAALVYHDKPRRSGEGGSHVHIVVGRIGPEGQVLPSGFEKIRLETACRLVEFEKNEAPVLGRHHASSLRWMRQNGRQDAAAWLEAAHGPQPEKPRSMASPDRRQAIERKGLVLGTVRETVAAAWSSSDGPKAFAAAMTAEGITVSPGEKSGVWIVAKDGVEVGSLDRLVKEKRRDVAAKMKGFEHVSAAASHVSTRENDRRGRAEIAPSALAPGGGAAEGGRADRAVADIARNPDAGPAPAPQQPRSPPRQDRRLEQAQAVQVLNQSQIRLSPAAMEAVREIRLREVTSQPVSRHESLQASRQIEASDGWDRLIELREWLLERCRKTYAAVLAYHNERQEEERQAADPEQAEIDRLTREIVAQRMSVQHEPDELDEPEYVYSGPRM